MSDQPIISVIVTTYNREELLKETLQSILSQTYKNIEVLVIDNYSDYDFVGLVNSLGDKRLIPYQNNNDGIIAVNRNFGLNKANGEYVAFCDDDDNWLPDKLEKQILCLINNHADLVYTYRIVLNENNEQKFEKVKIISNLFSFFMGNPITTSSVLLRKDEARFDEDLQLICVEDYFLWLEFFNKNKKFVLLKEYLVVYRDNGQSISKIRKIESYKKYYYAILKFSIKYRINKIYLIPIFIKAGLGYLKFFDYKFQVK